MAKGFTDLHFHAADQTGDGMRGAGAPSGAMRGAARSASAPEMVDNRHAAARMYLSAMLGGHEQPAAMRGLTAPGRPELVPDLRLRDIQTLPQQDTQRGVQDGPRTSIVRFVQTKRSIPVLGSSAVVELNENNELLAVDAALADVKNVSHIPALGVAQALGMIADATGTKPDQLGDVDSPELTFFHDNTKDQWHLAYLFEDVPAAPADFTKGQKSHGLGRPLGKPVLDYLVDAHDGTILLYWSSRPTAGAVPVSCKGDDEYDKLQEFFGREANPAGPPGGPYELYDPMGRIGTYDFGGKNVDPDWLPANPVSVNGPQPNFAGVPGAVSAHYHAKCVDDFLRLVLARNGIDNKGMELVSCVNCIYLDEGPGPEWKNASWWRGRMWYGQVQEQGRLRSYSRYLDIIAHELAHGITETTADLVYRDQSGALNESFSDIFGVIVNNWDWTRTRTTGGDVGSWDWEIGKDWKGPGLPLRDMSDPTRTGDPNHMSKYDPTPWDSGGVHTNSNIHNKAAYNVLTAKDAQGQAMFTPRQVAILYYYCLLRLDRLANFKQAREALLSVAKTFFSGNPKLQEKVDAIGKAYTDVGIT
jgi:bacillolysin/neutral peptidase B